MGRWRVEYYKGETPRCCTIVLSQKTVLQRSWDPIEYEKDVLYKRFYNVHKKYYSTLIRQDFRSIINKRLLNKVWFINTNYF